MIIGFGKEGDIIDLDFLKENGFQIDLKLDSIFSENNYKFNFVGALVNKDDNLFVVFPKHYVPSNNLEEDFMMVFNMVRNKKNDGIFSIDSELNEESSFPFNEFFSIYDYFYKYGLPKDEIKYLSKTPNNKINWKASIDRSEKLISDGNLVLWGLFYEKKLNRLNMLAECMIIAINYTVEKFGFILNIDRIQNKSNIFYQLDFEYITEILYNMKNLFFKDIDVDLIDNLIKFFAKISKGYNYYFKEYYFNNIWEKMVENLLNSNFNIETIKLSSNLEFKKTKFYFESLDYEMDTELQPNKVLEVDHFCIDHDTKIAYIFDSKYKNLLNNLDYKQIVYWIYVRDLLDSKDMSDYQIECCLIAPTEGDNFVLKKHLEMTKGERLRNIRISELYIDTRWMVEFNSK